MRRSHERYGGLGFIPGSIALPPDAPSMRLWERACERTAPQIPVFVCLSGLGSRNLVRLLHQEHEIEALYLEGGVVRWSSEGLPLCGQVKGLQQRETSARSFRRSLASQFVGQLAAIALERDLDPLVLLRECFDAAQTSFEHPDVDALPDVIDRAAACCLRLGVPLRRVADQVDQWLGSLPKISMAQA